MQQCRESRLETGCRWNCAPFPPWSQQESGVRRPASPRATTACCRYSIKILRQMQETFYRTRGPFASLLPTHVRMCNCAWMMCEWCIYLWPLILGLDVCTYMIHGAYIYECIRCTMYILALYISCIYIFCMTTWMRSWCKYLNMHCMTLDAFMMQIFKYALHIYPWPWFFTLIMSPN